MCVLGCQFIFHCFVYTYTFYTFPTLLHTHIYIYIYIYMDVWVALLSKEMNSMSWNQNLDKAVQISFPGSALRKGMNPSFLPPTMSKIIGKVKLGSFVRPTYKWKRKNLYSKHVECSGNQWHICGLFFCYELTQKVLLVLHRPSPQ